MSGIAGSGYGSARVQYIPVPNRTDCAVYSCDYILPYGTLITIPRNFDFTKCFSMELLTVVCYFNQDGVGTSGANSRMSDIIGRLLLGLGVAVGSLSALSPGVVAQSAGKCTCVSSYHYSSGSAGSIESMKGGVLVLQKTGFRPASVGQSLTPATRIITQANGTASLQVGGSCRVDLAPNSVAAISFLKNSRKLCVQVAEPTIKAAHDGPEPHPPPSEFRTPVFATFGFGGLITGLALSDVSD